MDTMVTREELSKKLQELHFYAVELNLFLDTHPNDVQALKDYKYILDSIDQLSKIYEKNFGSLMNFGHASVTGNYWNWVSPNEQWPWENRRV